MANVPFPLTGSDIEELKLQLWELIRQVFEEKIGGADLGDVFAIVGDVLTLVLATASGLKKTGNELSIEVKDDGGIQLSATGASLKLVSTGGLETTTSGLGIKLDGATLTLGAAGIKVTNPAEDAFPVGAIYLNITGVNPNTELGYGTWTQVAQGLFLVGHA